MTTKKKSFKVVYNLILDGVLSEKEAYNLIEGIFDREVMQIPVPVPTIEEENTQESGDNKEEITVKGFGIE